MKYFLHKLFVLSLVLFFSSCAYYNTFYNTKKLYKEAKKERENRTSDTPSASEKKKYDDTIEKASKVLELFPDSKYVDDSVMILGECFYYKEDYIKAQRKFQELIQYFPQSEYFYKAKIWLAKTYIELKDYPSARLILTELSTKEKLDKKIKQEARFIAGEIYFSQENYVEAEAEFEQAVEIDEDDLLTAKSYFKLGQTQIHNKKYEAAAKSFTEAIDKSPNQQFEFESWLNYAKSLKLSGDFKKAARICNELLDNELFKKNHGYVQLEIADIIYREGKANEGKSEADKAFLKTKIHDALESYEIVILQNKRTEVSAEAYFRVAEIKEYELDDFAGAKESYEKVQAEYRNSEFVEEANKRAEDLGELIKFSNEVKRALGQQLIESGSAQRVLSDLELLLLEHGNHPELRFRELQRASGILSDAEDEGESTGKPKEDKLTRLIKSKLQLAEIYLFRFNQVDSALYEYREVLELFPEHPYAAKALYSMAYINEHMHQNKFKTDSILYQVVLQYPESEQAAAARRKLDIEDGSSVEPAAELFKRAEYSLFQQQNINKALTEYQRVAETFPESAYASKALYAMGWIHEKYTSDYSKAREIYGQFVEKYPNSEFANPLKKKIEAKETVAAVAEKAPGEPEAATSDDSTLVAALEQPELTPADGKDVLVASGNADTVTDTLGAYGDGLRKNEAYRDRRPQILKRRKN